MEHAAMNESGSSRGAPPEGADTAGEPRKGTGQYTVFLVEDDFDDRLQMTGVLKDSPYIHDIHAFESADRLREHFRKEGYYGGQGPQGPALILLDIHMPGTSGIEFLRELKGNPQTRDIPVIIITGDTSSERTQEAYHLKANAYVTKPIHLDYIHEVIYTGWGWPARHKKSR